MHLLHYPISYNRLILWNVLGQLNKNQEFKHLSSMIFLSLWSSHSCLFFILRQRAFKKSPHEILSRMFWSFWICLLHNSFQWNWPPATSCPWLLIQPISKYVVGDSIVYQRAKMFHWNICMVASLLVVNMLLPEFLKCMTYLSSLLHCIFNCWPGYQEKADLDLVDWLTELWRNPRRPIVSSLYLYLRWTGIRKKVHFCVMKSQTTYIKT